MSIVTMSSNKSYPIQSWQKELETISDGELEQILAANDFAFYVEYVHRGKYIPARHTEYLCDVLNKVENGEIPRLLMCMPPRHSKSMTVSETFPSFFIGRNPDRRVIEISYSERLARRFGRHNRSKIEEFGKDVFGVCISDGNSSVTDWGMEGFSGGMISAGIGGSITGEGADLLLVDDPIKNALEASSETYRERVWDEWQNTFLTRLHPGACVIVILTRWHEDDLAGRLLREEPEKWTVISLPAEAEENDLLGREIGQPLWPDHGFDRSWIQSTKQAVGSMTWASLYQQRPSPQEGSLVQRSWWKYYTQIPSRFDEVLLSWDCSFKDISSSRSGQPDYVVGQVWGRVGANKYLLDQIRDRMDFPTTVRAVRTLSHKWPQARTKLIEDKANGTAVISVLKNEISGIVPVEPQGGKVVRVQAISADIEAGNVYLPDSGIARWVGDYVEEWASFPNGRYDDQVDATSQALLKLGSGMASKVRVYGKKPRGW